MTLSNIEDLAPEALAPILLSALQRLGQIGRDGAIALALLVDDGDVDFDEAAEWIADIAGGKLRE